MVKFKVRGQVRVTNSRHSHRIAERLCEFCSGPFIIGYYINAHLVVPSDGYVNMHSRVHEKLKDLRDKALCVKRKDCNYW